MSRRGRAGLLLAVLLAWPAAAGADETAPETRERGRRAGTYLKTGLAHWQGNIFSSTSLTQWNVRLLSIDYDLTSVSVQVERYFGGTFLQVSGFSVGYRKDAVRHVDSGHLFSGTLFRDFDLKAFALKAGGGAEWGVPALTFDRTEFETAGDGTLRYRHTHPARNAAVPFVGTRTDAAVYPFAELSVVQRPWMFLLETGMRVNIVPFHFDDYEVSPGGQVTHAFTRRRVLVPYLFVNLGLRLF